MAIDAAQQMIPRHVLIKAKTVEETPLIPLKPTHHRSDLLMKTNERTESF